MNVLVIHGHPEAGSFGEALADAYERGARSAGHDVRVLRMREMQFDPVLRGRAARDADAEPDVVAAREALSWANHVVLEYPTWWASTPALLKGFLDRVLVPGFAYRYRAEGKGWDKLLSGRSARVIVTMDAPTFFDSLWYFASSRRAVSKGVFWFCGFAPVRVTTFGSVRDADAAKRAKWLAQVEGLGRAGR